MKLLVVLLVVGLACYGHGAEEQEQCDMKEDMIGPEEESFGSKSGLLAGSSSANPFDQSPPPAVVTAAEAGLSMDSAGNPIIPGIQIPHVPAPCAHHHVFKGFHPVVDDYVSSVPVVRNYVRDYADYVTRHVPVVSKYVSTSAEKRVRQVPVLKKTKKYVVDKEIRHVPVVKTRVVPTVQYYTQYVRVAKPYNRTITDIDQVNIPVLLRKIRPVITQRVHNVPVTNRVSRPVVHTEVQHVPVSQPFVRTVCEPRLHTTFEPCNPSEYYSNGVYFMTPKIRMYQPTAEYETTPFCNLITHTPCFCNS